MNYVCHTIKIQEATVSHQCQSITLRFAETSPETFRRSWEKLGLEKFKTQDRDETETF